MIPNSIFEVGKNKNVPSVMIADKDIILDISKINQNDEKVFSLLSTGETTGLSRAA